MRIRTVFLLAIWWVGSVMAEEHITISNPASWTTQALAPYVGQTVVFDQPMVVSSNTGSNLTLSPQRRFVPINQAQAGTPEYQSVVRTNSQNAVSLSGVYDYHRCGEKVYNLRATVNSPSSLSWVSGTWLGNTRADLTASLPELGEYRLLICTMNLENYFVVNIGNANGARTWSDHQKQRAKISKALARINADVYGIVEVETGDDALKELTDDLNANLSGRQYTYMHDNRGTSTNIKSDFIYDAAVVEPVGSAIRTTERRTMVCFREKSTGERFILSVNHFKAKSGSIDSYNSDRVAEASSVLNTYSQYWSNPKIQDKDVLIMGDLNAYAKEEPILLMIDNGMIDLHRAFHADSSYSYHHDGLAGYLDHALCNETLYRQVTGMASYTINSDELDAYTYDKSNDATMFRCSDHDPILVGLALDSTLSNPLNPHICSTCDSLTLYDVYDLNDPDDKSYFAIYSIDGLRICPVSEIKYTEEMMQQKERTYTIAESNPYLPEEIKQFMPLPDGMYILHIYYKGKVITQKFFINR